MTDRKAITRLLDRAGYVHLRPGWVRKEDAVKLQAQIDKAVERAAEEVERIRNGVATD